MRNTSAFAIAFVFLTTGALAIAAPPSSTSAAPSANTPAAQSHAPFAVNVLGRSVPVYYGRDVSSNDRSTISNAFSSAANLLDRHAKDFNAGEERAIAQIHSVAVIDSPTTCLGEIGGHSMRLSVHYLRSISALWLASIFGHEGQHFLDAGQYSGARSWQDEQKATETQLGIGKALGFSDAMLSYLENWGKQSNHVVLQKHMEQGYPPHCQTRQS